jgi:hypothetical protein
MPPVTEGIIMNTTCLPWPRSALIAIGLSAALVAGGAAGQAPPAAEIPVETPVVGDKPALPEAPPEIVEPVLPSKLDDPDAVFRRLDVAGRGYLTRDDTEELLGFDDAFRAADPKRSGKLTPVQFRKAWSIYRSKK